MGGFCCCCHGVTFLHACVRFVTWESLSGLISLFCAVSDLIHTHAAKRLRCTCERKKERKGRMGGKNGAEVETFKDTVRLIYT